MGTFGCPCSAKSKHRFVGKTNESTKAVLSFVVLLFPEEFHRAHSGLCAVRDRFCDLEQAAGAVSCGEQPGHGGRAVGVRPDMRAVERRAELSREIRAACGAERDEHTVERQRLAVRENHALDRLAALDGGDRPGIDRKAVRKVLRRALAVRQECDRACDRKQHTRLLKGVFALSEHGGRLVAIEKRIADRAVAYAASLEFADACNIGHGTRRAGREQHRVCVALAVRRLDRKAGVGVLDARDLGAVKLCAEALRLRPAARQQLRARNHIGEAEIVFDFVGLSECAVVLVQHLNVKTCAHRIDRGAESGGTAADDNQCGHGASFTFRYPRGIPAGRPAAYG